MGVWAGPLGKTAFSDTLGLLGETTFRTGLWAGLLCVGDESVVLPGVYTGFNKISEGCLPLIFDPWREFW